jgi:hypothetical protein
MCSGHVVPEAVSRSFLIREWIPGKIMDGEKQILLRKENAWVRNTG